MEQNTCRGCGFYHGACVCNVRCPSMHWYDPTKCIKPKGHGGDHADAFGFTWTDADDAAPTHVARQHE